MDPSTPEPLAFPGDTVRWDSNDYTVCKVYVEGGFGALVGALGASGTPSP